MGTSFSAVQPTATLAANRPSSAEDETVREVAVGVGRRWPCASGFAEAARGLATPKAYTLPAGIPRQHVSEEGDQPRLCAAAHDDDDDVVERVGLGQASTSS